MATQQPAGQPLVSRRAADTRSALHALLAPVLRETGVELEEVSVRRIGTRRLVQVVVDADGGLDLEAVAAATRVVSLTLDTADPVTGAYTLEVSSRGVDRPLTAPRHWRGAIGRLVRLRTGERQLTARVVSVGETGVVVDHAGGTEELEFADIHRAVVEVEFGGGAA